ncbi:hypothetical protein [Gryllotalpicola protaetiae]|uniref:Septum formation-related domain-containing protein n=1 Tax=Gryllotalpicola protaetiae TaxID=2419771 RepID=A0A387BKT0_9MICO|nr:hypothetical protein [Gryllotalpicola protaetiae]AYG03268.1 hypothetical protein D7I44_06820 [Gryllotalpicola protaetiae]
MTDETKPPAGEPEPGSPEWLLAQLSGGRIDSRRERREAEAALEAAGLPIPDATGEAPAVPPTPAPAEERPRARFSWETGTLEAVGADQVTDAGTEPAPDAETPPAAAPEQRALAADAPPAPPVEPAARQPDGDLPQSSAPGAAIPFMWNLTPTNEPDPAVNPRAEVPEPAFNEPDFPFPSAAPLVVPRPARPLITETPLAEPQAPLVAAEPQAPALVEPAAPAFPFSFGDEPALPVPPPAPGVPVADEPAPADDQTAPAPPAALGPAPLPPGTTAHEFDPFAQDIFGSRPSAATPVPSVDEFTIPDEGSPAQASAPAPEAEAAESVAPAADGKTQVTSDWSDIADMLGAHPETVDTAIVSPMPPVNEILPSFDAVLPRGLGQAPDQGRGAATPPPARPANAPIEHSRERSPLNRWLLIAAAILVAILIGIALFTLGRSIAAGRDQAPAAATHTSTPSPKATTPTPTPTPTQTADQTVAGNGPLAPGQSYQWDQLNGGECIDPFGSPWAQTFAVVDCNAQHAAQLVYTAPFASDPSAPFPGEQAISSQVNLLCSKPGVIDLHAAAAYNDVQVVAAYPVNAEQWNSGQRNYFCFVTRSSGQQFSSSIAGPGPTQ